MDGDPLVCVTFPAPVDASAELLEILAALPTEWIIIADEFFDMYHHLGSWIHGSMDRSIDTLRSQLSQPQKLFT